MEKVWSPSPAAQWWKSRGHNRKKESWVANLWGRPVEMLCRTIKAKKLREKRDIMFHRLNISNLYMFSPYCVPVLLSGSPF